jgi:hypothetical protein
MMQSIYNMFVADDDDGDEENQEATDVETGREQQSDVAFTQMGFFSFDVSRKYTYRLLSVNMYLVTDLESGENWILVKETNPLVAFCRRIDTFAEDEVDLLEKPGGRAPESDDTKAPAILGFFTEQYRGEESPVFIVEDVEKVIFASGYLTVDSQTVLRPKNEAPIARARHVTPYMAENGVANRTLTAKVDDMELIGWVVVSVGYYVLYKSFNEKMRAQIATEELVKAYDRLHLVASCFVGNAEELAVASRAVQEAKYKIAGSK